MITRRALKKKSKAARAILIAHYRYTAKSFFLSERGDNYHGLRIRCDHIRKPGRFSCDCQSHPLKCTPMIGEMKGYYEPEWDEHTALEELRQKVEWEARPGSMSEHDWRRTLAVAGVKPITQADVDAWFRDDEEAFNAAEPVCEAVDR